MGGKRPGLAGISDRHGPVLTGDIRFQRTVEEPLAAQRIGDPRPAGLAGDLLDHPVPDPERVAVVADESQSL